MTPPISCTGPPAPEWMDTVESIDAAARMPRARIGPLMGRTGACVVGMTIGAENVALADRSTGVVYHWFATPQEVGSIAAVSSMCNSTGKPDHQWDMRMRILRAVDISEVRAMAAKWGGPTPLKLREGIWCEVMTD